METCPICFYPSDICDCDPDTVHYALRNQEDEADFDRRMQRDKEMRDRNAQMVREVMQYQYIQVMNDDNSPSS